MMLIGGIANQASAKFTPPTLSNLIPAHNSQNVAVDQVLTISFNVNVKAGTGDFTISPIDPLGADIVVDVSDPEVTISGSDVSIDLGPDFELFTEYEVTFPSGVILQDSNDDPFAGITANNWRFITVPGDVNITAPSLNLCNGGGYSTLDPIVINETTNGTFATGAAQTLILSIPAGAEFNPGVGSVASTGNDITNIVVSSVLAGAITITYDVGDTEDINSIIISGLQVRGTAVGSGNITRTGGTAVQTGSTNGTIHASLSASAAPGAPVLTLGVNEFCEGFTFTTEQVSATGSNVIWYSDAALTNQIGTGGTLNLTAIGINTAITGTTTIYATQTVSGCTSNAATQNIIIKPNPNVFLVSDDADNEICFGEQVTFTALGDATTYQFLIGGSPVTTQGTTTATTFTTSATLSSGAYQVSVRGILNGCITTTADIDLTINALPNVTFVAPPTTSFPNDQTTAVNLTNGITFGGAFNGTVQGPLVGSYSGNGVVGNQFYPNIAGTGSHTITYAYTDGNGCTNTATTSLTVYNPNTLILNLASSYCTYNTAATGLVPNPAAIPGTILGYTMSGTGVSGTANNPYTFNPGAFSVTTPTLFFINMSVTNQVGPVINVLNINVPVIVSGRPTLVLAASSTTACANDNAITFTTTSDGATVTSGTTFEYRTTSPLGAWTPLGGTTFDPGTFGEGTYQVRFRYSNAVGCEGTSNRVNLTINRVPLLDFTGLNTAYCISANPVNLTPTDHGVAITGANLSDVLFEIRSLPSGVFSPMGGTTFRPQSLTDGDYEIQFSYKDGNGCSAISGTKTVTINELPNLNFTGLNAEYCVTDGAFSLTPTVNGSSTIPIPANIQFMIKRSSETTYTNLPGNTINPAVTGSGDFDVQLSYTDGNMCANVSDVETFTVHALPILSFTGLDATYCNNITNVQLRAGANGVQLTPGQGNFELSSTSATTGFAINVALNSATYVFDPSQLTAGTYWIRFRYTDGNGCEGISTAEQITVFAAPVLNFTGLNAAYCISETSVPLTPTNNGVAITGTDLSNVIFEIRELPAGNFSAIAGTTLDPSSITDGDYEVRFTYADGNGCTATSAPQTVTIHELPTLNFTGLNADYCISDGSFTVTPFVDGSSTIPIPGNIQFKLKKSNVTTFTNIASGTIDPMVIGSGDFDLTFTYTDGNSCVNTADVQRFTINPLPVLSFTGLEATYCNDIAEVELTPSSNGVNLAPGEGIFELSSVSATAGFSINAALNSTTNEFEPPLLIPGTYWVRYRFTDGNNCENVSPAQQVIVYASPKQTLDFTFSNTCFNEVTQFIPIAADTNANWTWQWEFGDNGITSQVKNATHQFSTFNAFVVKLTATNENNCSFTIQKTVVINPVPVANFTFSGACLGEPTEFTDASTVSSPGIVNQWTWDFGDGNTSNQQNPEHSYAAIGTYNVTLTINTDGGCPVMISKTINIFPLITVTEQQQYLQDFNQSDAGWIAGGQNSSWIRGVPAGAKIRSTGTGDQAWITNLATTYNADEQSYVESPCFNIDALQRPFISVRIWTDTDEDADGAILLASLDDGQNWRVVGNINQGLEWYNQIGIQGNPGSQGASLQNWNGSIIGWAGNTDTTWREARFMLDDLKNEIASDPDYRTVRFRIAFGSDQTNPFGTNLDGFAFDDFFVGERNRTVLIEHFTNVTDQNAINENNAVDQFTTDNSPEVVNLQYHTIFPGTDPFNQDNPAAPSARALYYGVGEVPRTAIDGLMDNNQVFSDWGTDYYSRRTLLVSPFNINVDFTGTSGSDLQVQAQINSILPFTGNVIVHMVVVEREINGITNDGIPYRNVVKKMLPSAAGTLVEWTNGKTTESITQRWTLQNVYNPQQISVVVFIQDDVTKEVYQAAIGNAIGLQRVRNVQGAQAQVRANDIILYPNPTTHQVFISVPKSLEVNTQFKIIDMQGKIIGQGKLNEQTGSALLNTHSWAEGVYFVEFESKGKVIRKRLIKK
ncbi:hypothetical protein BKI52_33360 [marine bacterium AO1-C]|nr:hypothetical protein BKI52_33360 [marine bacterium AO1-C]